MAKAAQGSKPSEKETASQQQAPSAQQAKVAALRTALSTKYLERSNLVDCLLVSLISGQPLITLGPPGSAKSALCRDVATAIKGDYFEWMLGRFTVPEELFGPLSLKALEQDRYCRVMTGKLPCAHVVFIDEVGKASESISNTLLGVMNEKTFFNDGKAVPLPILTLVGASNEVPQAEGLGAFYDRFVLRYFVEYVREESSVRKLFTGLDNVAIPTMSVQDVLDLRTLSEAVTMPASIEDLLVKIRRACEQAQIMVSDRKWRQIVQVVKATTVLEGRTVIEEDDLVILNHMLWSDPGQIPEVKQLIAKLVNPISQKILAILDGITGLNLNEQDAGKQVEVYRKIDHAKKALLGMGDPEKNKKLADAIAIVDAKGVIVKRNAFK